MTNSIPEIGNTSDVIFIIGSNTGECHPLVARQVILARERGAELIVADPRKTDIARNATLFLSTPPGYNIPLINGMINVIISENLHNHEFIEKHTEGFAGVAEAVREYTPERVEAMCGIPTRDIVRAARLYARARAAVVLYAMGVTQHTHGTASVASLANLVAITGQIGRPGAGICPLRGQNNVQGACDMGALPGTYPAYAPVTDEVVATRYEKAWGVPLSRKPGLKVTEVPKAIQKGQVRALCVFGENPLMSDPDSAELRKELAHLDLLVVMDIFMTETARLADVVFPAAGWAEKTGTFSNTERRVQLVRKAVDAPGLAMPDWWIFSQLAKRLGYSGMEYSGTDAIWDEMRGLAPASFGGITHERLNTRPGLCWPCPDEHHPGTPILHRDGKFVRAGNKAQLVPVFFDPETLPEHRGTGMKNRLLGRIAEHADKEYPFVLTTGRRVYHYHTGTMTRKSPVLDRIGPEELVEVNAVDAAQLGIINGDYITLATRRGRVTARAWVTDRIRRGVLFATFHFWEACCNELTGAGAVDPVSGIPEFKVSAVAVSRSTEEEHALALEQTRATCHVSLERSGTASVTTSPV